MVVVTSAKKQLNSSHLSTDSPIMAYKSVLLSVTALFASVGLAQDKPPTKPVISPALDYFNTMEAKLVANMPLQSFTSDDWGAGWIPQDCFDQAKVLGKNPADMLVFNVHYSDCPEPWIMCLHKDVASHKSLMIDRFGRVPLQMREYIRHISHYPGALNGAAAATNSGDNIAVGGDSMQMAILAHEISHSLDSHALQQYASGQFSLSSIWRDNYNQDSRVPTDYSLTAWAEDFAETGVVGIFDRVVPGGLGSINPNWHDIFHQYATYQGYLGNIIPPAHKSQCTSRLANSPPVPNGASSEVRRSARPNVNFKTNIAIIPPANTSCSGLRI
ncbi:hypothetical protein VTK73DRAFT_3784 [Phialemonium thermophilum]|uniref:Conidiation-specific protein 13 n=1 Tax=Phialemonium thermophilum TaxID=223376 RepID=A0ABR3WXN1_9PEZI